MLSPAGLPRLLTAIFVALFVWAHSGVACPVLGEDEQIRQAQEERAEVANWVKDVWDESDLVLIARIVSTSEERHPASQMHPRSDSDLEVAGEVIQGRSVVEPLRVLKGKTAKRLSLRYERDESTIEINCGAVRYFRSVAYLMDSYRYLLYVRDGQVIRANRIIDWFDDLDVKEELRMLNATTESTRHD